MAARADVPASRDLTHSRRPGAPQDPAQDLRILPPPQKKASNPGLGAGQAWGGVGG